MSSKDRMELVTKLSQFLSIPVASTILESSSSYSLKAVENGFQMVSAGPGSGDNCNLKQYTEILWGLPCSTIRHLTDFVRVLQHNVDVGRLQEEINAIIVGWYVASSNSLLTRQARRRRRALQRTIASTPVLHPVTPTTVGIATLEDMQASSVDLTSLNVYLLSSISQFVSQEHIALSNQIVTTSSSTSTLPATSSDVVSSVHTQTSSFTSSVLVTPSSLLLLSASSESFEQAIQPSSTVVVELTRPTLQPPSTVVVELTGPTLQPSSTVVGDSLQEIQSIKDYQLTSTTSFILLSPYNYSSTNVSVPSITDVSSQQSHNLSKLLSSSISLSDSQQISISSANYTLSVVSLLLFSQPELSSTISLDIPDSETEILTSRTQVSATDDDDDDHHQTLIGIHVSTIINATSVLVSDVNVTEMVLESDYSVTPPLLFTFSHSSLFSVVPLDSVFLVTSRAVEIIFAAPSSEQSIGIQSSIYAYPSHTPGNITVSSFDYIIDQFNSTIESYSAEISETQLIFDSQSFEQGHGGILEQSEEVTPTTLSMTTYSTSLPYVISADSTSDLNTISTTLDYDIFSSIIDLKTDQTFTESSETYNAWTSAVAEESSSLIMYSLSTENIFPSTVVPEVEIAVTVYDSASANISGFTSVLSIQDMVVSSRIIDSVFSTIVEFATPESLLTTAWTPTISTVVTATETFPVQTDTNGTANNRPYVKNAIRTILAEQGRLLEFRIPHDVFLDIEDGNTSSLTLSLDFPGNRKLPSNFWLSLDSDKQILKGLPLHADMSMNNFSVLLVARDSGGLTTTDTISIQIKDLPWNSFTHVFVMKFALDYQQFMSNCKNLTDLIVNIGSYFNADESKYMTILNVSSGSLVLSWTNNTLTGPVCQMDMIKSILHKTIRPDGTVRPSFYRQVGLNNHLSEILFQPLGVCYVPSTTVRMTTITNVVSDPSKGHGLSIWAHVILPVLIAVLVFILIILIIVFCNRRRRQRHAVLNAEKEAVSNDRNPVIFPDELDTDDPSLKARDPLVLPTDPHKSTQLNSSPSKNSGGPTKSRSKDNGEQEWLNSNSNAQEGEQEHDHRRKRDSKKQRDPSRVSEVTASSTLPRDRPNNHYLEEEAGSRSNTLTSTQSSGSDKRHPKNPPPYWQSQSDAPPYRLPPPYLTNSTTQV